MGGYNMAMVDEFLDELTDDYTALYKENAALKAKLKVLVEKVEDYRATEDSMRATLLTAQKMADSIVHEAEAKRDEILAQAETSAREKIGQLRQEVEAAEERLHQGQRDLAQFIAASREICEKELKFLEQLPGGGEAEETFYFLPGRRDSGAAGMMESARALSRTVQRDARRYDGGFPLYD